MPASIKTVAASLGLSISLLAGSLVAPNVAHAEGEIRIAEQFGIVYLLLNVVRDQNLIEKHGKEEGIDIKVDWTQLSGGAAVNDALLSGSIDIALCLKREINNGAAPTTASHTVRSTRQRSPVG